MAYGAHDEYASMPRPKKAVVDPLKHLNPGLIELASSWLRSFLRRNYNIEATEMRFDQERAAWMIYDINDEFVTSIDTVLMERLMMVLEVLDWQRAVENEEVVNAEEDDDNGPVGTH